MLKIQTTIVGFGGQAVTAYSAYDQESKILVISVITPYRRERNGDCMVITNDPQIERDSLFTNADLKEAINAYFAMSGGVATDGKSSRLVYSDKAIGSAPSIEKDGVDDSGIKYRISDSVTCQQIATLATALHCCTRADSIDSVFSFMDDFSADLSRLEIGGIMTI